MSEQESEEKLVMTPLDQVTESGITQDYLTVFLVFNHITEFAEQGIEIKDLFFKPIPTYRERYSKYPDLFNEKVSEKVDQLDAIVAQLNFLLSHHDTSPAALATYKRLLDEAVSIIRGKS